MDLDIQEILKGMRETIGSQAQEIAVLKATIAKLAEVEPEPKSDSKE